MIKTSKLLAAGLLLTLAAVSCTRSASTNTPTPASVYASAPSLADVGDLLGDSGGWWPAAPTFGVRPLDISNTAQEQRFALTLRYSHLGTPETLKITYNVWDTTQVATAILTNIQTSIGSTLTGPSAGDQVLYYNQMLSFSGAPYSSNVLMRIGQTLVSIEWDRTAGYATTSQSGRLAGRIASRLKSSLAGKLSASPRPALDASLLPAPGPDLTLLGATRLPIDVLASILDAASPTDFRSLFGQFGVTDFAYGDYTLDSDTHMEVQTAAMSFTGPSEATNWIDTLIGASSLDTSGVYSNFDSATEQYVFVFASGSRGVVIVCKSSADFEAASRSCELPLSRVVVAWKAALAAES